MNRHPTPSSAPMPFPPLPERADEWSLFVDIDGTLIGFEDHPDDVHLPVESRFLLDRVRLALGGALAILSGRSLDDIDRLMSPLTFAAGALHGAARRDPCGDVQIQRVPEQVAERIIHECTDAIRTWTGVFLEAKEGISFALHYRGAPGFETAVRGLVTTVARDSEGIYAVQFGNCVAELVPAVASKGSSLAALASGPPFAGRRPVVVGDDLTDESAFEQALALGGFGVLVGARRPTRARYALDGPSATLAWMHDLALHLEKDSVR